jgi:nitrite transporter NirC
MASRTTSDGAKLGVLFWGLLAFVASGFEHSIANMTVFSLAVFEGAAHWSDLARNLIYTIPGNIVGGALLVAAPYAWLGRPKASTDAYPAEAAAEPMMIPEPTAVPEPV